MKTVLKSASAIFTERGSKFLGYLYPAVSQSAVDNYLAELKQQYPDATHHCYAFRINPGSISEFAQDDGEPGGTAGLPILNALKSEDLINVLLVVIRYFGGVKLGKPGLIHSYRTTAEKCIALAETAGLVSIERFRISYPYPEQKRIDQLFHKYELKGSNEHYAEAVSISIECDARMAADFKKEIRAMDHLGIGLEEKGRGYGIIKND